jgi:hypothetical protein
MKRSFWKVPRGKPQRIFLSSWRLSNQPKDKLSYESGDDSLFPVLEIPINIYFARFNECWR